MQTRGLHRLRPRGACGSSESIPEPEFLNDSAVAVDVSALHVVQKAATSANHLEKAAARGMIFGVALQVFGQMLDPAGEKCYLHIRAASIFFMQLELLETQRFRALCHKRAAILDDNARLASIRGGAR